MEDLPEDLRAFLRKHPCFQLTDAKKVNNNMTLKLTFHSFKWSVLGDNIVN